MSTEEIKSELLGRGYQSGPSMDALAGQIARLRDAQARIDAEGLIIADAKGNPIPHPAIEIERKAQAEIRAWNRGS